MIETMLTIYIVSALLMGGLISFQKVAFFKDALRVVLQNQATKTNKPVTAINRAIYTVGYWITILSMPVIPVVNTLMVIGVFKKLKQMN